MNHNAYLASNMVKCEPNIFEYLEPKKSQTYSIFEPPASNIANIFEYSGIRIGPLGVQWSRHTPFL